MAYSLKVSDAALGFFRLQGLYVWQADRCCYVRHTDTIKLDSGSGSVVYASVLQISSSDSEPKFKKLTLLDTDGRPEASEECRKKYVSSGLYTGTMPYVRPEASMHMERGGRITFVLGEEVLSFSAAEIGPSLQEIKRPANATDLLTAALACGISRCVGGTRWDK